MSCLFGKIGWYFLRRLRAWHDFRFKTHSITEATRRNYSKNHTFCDMFSPFCENWFWRETAKIFTFIPVFSTQCPPYFLSSSAFSSTLMAAIFVPHVCLSARSASLSPCWCVRLFLPHTYLYANPQTPSSKLNEGKLFLTDTDVLALSSLEATPIIACSLSLPVTNSQLILFVQIACTLCLF